MNGKAYLKQLIDDSKQPNVSEWVYNVETFLSETGELSEEAKGLISGIKKQGTAFNRCDNLLALLNQLYKRKYEKISVPEIKKNNQIFVAMMFSEETNQIYESAYKPLIKSFNYEPMRIDEKVFVGSIIEEIILEISNSSVLIADLTGNRGGVYYEAGIARGLQLCNHPIKLILTCQSEFFKNEKVHFDVSGDNIILYNNTAELTNRLSMYLKDILSKEQMK